MAHFQSIITPFPGQAVEADLEMFNLSALVLIFRSICVLDA